MSRRDTGGPDGVLVVDKPAGPTSHDVVARVRRLAGTRRVGHAGTLDPAATGVLVLGLGRGTRLLAHLVGADKEYLATARLGVATASDDAQGDVLARADASAVTGEDVRRAAAALTGPLQQVPSSVSAKRVDGRRAHELVREGVAVELAPRPVVVSAFDVLALRPGREDVPGALPHLDVDVRVAVSSGTYVRALARDAGAALGVGGSLVALRRTRVGPHGLAGAATLEQLADDGVAAHLLDLAAAAAAAFPVLAADAEQARRLALGQRLAPLGLAPGTTAAVGPDGALVALVQERDGAVRPVLVLAGATA